MLYLFFGTDREKTRAALTATVKKNEKKAAVVRISDANSIADLEMSFKGGGMFGESRAVVLEGILGNEEMFVSFMNALPSLKSSEDAFYLLEEKPDADTRKRIEKYAEKTERFDAPAKKREGGAFGMAYSLARKDKRALWLTLQRELSKGAAPEALHGILFWGAKDLFLKSKTEDVRERAKKLVATLAELPHEARRRGEELEYALERFVLSGL